MPRAVVLASVLLLLSACGGEEDKPPEPKATPDPVAQVRELAPKLISEAGGYELCFEHSTDRFIRAAFDGKRGQCGHLQRIIGPGTPKVLDVNLSGDRASASVEYGDSAIKGPFGTLGFVREAGVWKLDRLENDFMRSMAVASAQTLSVHALSVPEVQQCMARQMQKRSDSFVRRYVYALLQQDERAGRSALRLVEKCPKEVAIYVAEEIVRSLEEDGYSREYADCIQPRLEGYLALTGLAPKILSGSESKGMGAVAVGGLLQGIDKECRHLK